MSILHAKRFLIYICFIVLFEYAKCSYPDNELYFFTVYSLVGQECKDARQNTAGSELPQINALSQAPCSIQPDMLPILYIFNTLTYK